jgi:hypothetical protein
VKGELGGDVGIKRVGGHDVDGARLGVNVDRGGGEAPAQPRGEAREEAAGNFNVFDGHVTPPIQLLVDVALGDRPAIEERPGKWDPSDHREEQGGLHLLGDHDAGGDQARAKLERHGRTLYQMRAKSALFDAKGGVTRAPRGEARLTPGGELKDDLRLPDEAQVVPGDALDGRRVIPEAGDLAPKRLDLAPELGVILLDLRELALETSEPRETLGREDHDRSPDHGHHEDRYRQHSLHELNGASHAPSMHRSLLEANFPGL